MKILQLFISQKSSEYIKSLCSGSEADRRIRRYRRDKIRTFSAILLVTVLISIPVFVHGYAEKSTPVTKLKRNEFGGGDRTVSLYAVTDDNTGEKIRIDVHERQYTKEEIRDLSERMDDVLSKAILGRNADPQNVMYDLDLVKSLDGFPFAISWKTDRPQIISSRGVIDTKKLEDESGDGVQIMLCATIKYKDYSEDKYFGVIIKRQRLSGDTSGQESIIKSIAEEGDRTKESSYETLPEDISGKAVTFYDASVNKGWPVLFCGLMLGLLIMAAKDRRLKDEADKRMKQMDADYPNIVSQYILYYTAGMNPRAIWSAMCNRYEDEIAHGRGGRRYAYEEMMITKRLMDEGCEELPAYDEFAARCRNENYRSFVSLVKQTVEKGSASLGDLLYEETKKARRRKNDQIKIAASEAETKLLLPMFMMLVIVLVIVMVPAFIGLNG